jgi:hypothetical protein
MFGVRGMAIGAALTFGAVLWWATRGTDPAVAGSARLLEVPAADAGAFSSGLRTAPAGKNGPAAAPLAGDATAAPIASEEGQLAADANFDQYVSDKYRFLLEAEGRSPRGAERLRAALQERERMMATINTARQGNDAAERATLPERLAQLAAIDQRISQMLPAGDIAAFDVLKDSHIEQFQLDEYAQGIGNVAPLKDDQRRAILFSKLAYRQRFREMLDQSGLMREDMPVAQRQAALSGVSRALKESRDSFLQEARQHLGDEEQFALLANYENSEYHAELEKLRRIASGG